ncbi:MAG: hypothetical protein AAGD86_05720 [Pseudomonadota bacterium]
MKTPHTKIAEPVLGKVVPLLLCGVLVTAAGCRQPEVSDGTNVTETQLPLDTTLNLACENVGVFLDTCVLQDPENPFRNVPIPEFDANNPDAETKFDLEAGLPTGVAGAKSRFYLWATALARRSSGENQWYTARALHQLWDVGGDPIIQEQALKAYRSVLDNYFGSVTFFECCSGVNPTGDPVPFSITLNEEVADNLYRTESTGWARLVPGDPFLTQSLLSEWGYTYQPASPPLFNDGVLSVNDG